MTCSHLRRDLAESFGSDAERYGRTRPGYPRALGDRVLADPSDVGAVLDVGIGTGLAARPFRDLGGQVLGVEVDPRMVEVARRAGFTVEVARFEQWDPAGRLFDLVIAGQAWHWIDPVVGAEKAADVLRPGGRLAAFWNVADPGPALAEAFAEVYRSVDTGLPFTPWAASVDGYGPILDAAEAAVRAAGQFEGPVRWRTEWSVAVTRDAWLDQVPTAAGHNQLPPAVLEALLTGMGEAVDAQGGSFTMSYITVALLAERTRRMAGPKSARPQEI